MYTVLPKNEEEFENMVNTILSGYNPLPPSPEVILRLKIDINYLLKESKLEILNEAKTRKVVAYSVKKKKDGVAIVPCWAKVK
jgi:hypothetical protein